MGAIELDYCNGAIYFFTFFIVHKLEKVWVDRGLGLVESLFKNTADSSATGERKETHAS